MPNDPVKNVMKNNWAGEWFNEFGTNSKDNYYMFFGKTDSWGLTGDDNNDTFPPIGRDTTNDTFSAYRNSIGAKRIKQIDAMHIIPKNTWETGLIWDEYDPDIELFRKDKPQYEDINVNSNWPKKFFVMTNEYNVYECISNNGGEISTIQPSGINVNVIMTEDGYRWKFLYKIPEDLYRFITNDYIPVRYIESLDATDLETDVRTQWKVQKESVDGRVEHIDVITHGTAFVRSVPYCATQTQIGRVEYGTSDPLVDAPGSGITGGDVRAELVLNVHPKAHSTVDHKYAGYSVVIMTGGGAGQVRHITGYVAETRTLLLDRYWIESLNAGEEAAHSTYSIVPKCDIRGDGHEIEAVAKLYSVEDLDIEIAGEYQILERMDMISGGYGYTTGTAELYPRGQVNDTPAVSPEIKLMVAPKNGHGANAVKELGSDKIMIVVTFAQDENDDFTITNDFRMIGMIKNPIISSGGASGDGAYTGKVAGTEQPITAVLTVDAITDEGLFNDDSFQAGHYIIGDRSNTVAKIETWTYDFVSKEYGLLTVNSISNKFDATNAILSVTGEGINSFIFNRGIWSFNESRNYATVRSSSPFADDNELTYKLYHEMSVQALSGQSPLNCNTYPKDTLLVGEESKTTGIVLDWDAGETGTTGALKLIGVDGDFKKLENIYDISLYQDETADGTYSLPNAPQVSQIVTVDLPELVKGSGEMIYIQGMRPVMRNYEQEEDIKIVLGF